MGYACNLILGYTSLDVCHGHQLDGLHRRSRHRRLDHERAELDYREAVDDLANDVQTDVDDANDAADDDATDLRPEHGPIKLKTFLPSLTDLRIIAKFCWDIS